MNKVDRWLLPDGIEEILPGDARKLELLRRKFVDNFQRWGYDYVIPPMLEFTDSLFTGSGEDVELQTFKITDQISGKTMGIRADITPQAARMDAHSLCREGVNRLCYAGHVLHTRPKALLGSRAPIQAGVEMFGVSGMEADIEVVSLLIESLQAAGIDKVYLDLGHVGVYRSLVEVAELSREQELACFELLQAKAMTELDSWVDANISDEMVKGWFKSLPKLSGPRSIIEKALQNYASAPAALREALESLEVLAEALQAQYPEAQLYFDLSELRGYHYHTGIVFGAFAPGVGEAIANGGRYDRVGEAFGRARPATGFAVDLTAVGRLIALEKGELKGIFAPLTNSPEQLKKIHELRNTGERVVCGVAGQHTPLEHQSCDRLLVEVGGDFQVKSLED